MSFGSGVRRLGRWLGAAILFVMLAIAAGTLAPRPLGRSATAQTEGAEHRILVLANPIHTDIAIRLTTETRTRFSFLEDSGMPLGHPDARWLVFGWGGRAFYLETPTWSDLKPLPLLKGLTLDWSVIHTGVTGDIVETDASVSGYEIDEAKYQNLLSFIESSFAAEDGLFAIPDAGYGPNDRFFEAKGWFSAFLGCNTWTARALREAGLRTGWWNPLPISLSASLALYN